MNSKEIKDINDFRTWMKENNFFNVESKDSKYTHKYFTDFDYVKFCVIDGKNILVIVEEKDNKPKNEAKNKNKAKKQVYNKINFIIPFFEKINIDVVIGIAITKISILVKNVEIKKNKKQFENFENFKMDTDENFFELTDKTWKILKDIENSVENNIKALRDAFINPKLYYGVLINDLVDDYDFPLVKESNRLFENNEYLNNMINENQILSLSNWGAGTGKTTLSFLVSIYYVNKIAKIKNYLEHIKYFVIGNPLTSYNGIMKREMCHRLSMNESKLLELLKSNKVLIFDEYQNSFSKKNYYGHRLTTNNTILKQVKYLLMAYPEIECKIVFIFDDSQVLSWISEDSNVSKNERVELKEFNIYRSASFSLESLNIGKRINSNGNYLINAATMKLEMMSMQVEYKYYSVKKNINDELVTYNVNYDEDSKNFQYILSDEEYDKQISILNKMLEKTTYDYLQLEQYEIVKRVDMSYKRNNYLRKNFNIEKQIDIRVTEGINKESLSIKNCDNIVEIHSLKKDDIDEKKIDYDFRDENFSNIFINNRIKHFHDEDISIAIKKECFDTVEQPGPHGKYLIFSKTTKKNLYYIFSRTSKNLIIYFQK